MVHRLLVHLFYIFPRVHLILVWVCASNFGVFPYSYLSLVGLIFVVFVLQLIWLKESLLWCLKKNNPCLRMMMFLNQLPQSS
jgi:hypothetical protein